MCRIDSARLDILRRSFAKVSDPNDPKSLHKHLRLREILFAAGQLKGEFDKSELWAINDDEPRTLRALNLVNAKDGIDVQYSRVLTQANFSPQNKTMN